MMKPSWREYSNCLAASLMAKHLKKLSSKPVSLSKTGLFSPRPKRGTDLPGSNGTYGLTLMDRKPACQIFPTGTPQR
jgi:hypothetical protein